LKKNKYNYEKINIYQKLQYSCGGGVILSCKNDSFMSFLEPNASGNLSIKEAQAWFTDYYLKKYESARKNSALSHKRVPNWKEAKEVKSDRDISYILVPVNYEETGRPSFMAWNDETEFRTKIPQYFANPIFEALIIHTDDKGNTEAYLSQIAYDRFHLKDGIFNLDTFTGGLLKSEWDDTLIEGRLYSNGKHGLTLNPETSRNRIADCDIYYFTYYTYDGHSCGTNCYEFEITEHRTYFVSCSGSGGGGGGYPYAAPGGGGFGGGSGEGGFHIPEFAPNTTNFELKKAICNPGGIDRTTVNNNLATALNALGISAGVATLSNNMIEALVRSIGGTDQGVKIIQTVVGKTVGKVAFIWGGYEAFMGLVDGDITENDMLDVLEVVAGIGAVVAGGWLAVGYGTISLGIAIYQTANTPSCD
jgi:hypothetical protein